ncbi:MAG: thiamine diphosphokinase, partial [Lentisphaeria bacterium]|nr:thiamine diphosphokinase [Lentisphaeria bacterium]
HCVVGDLDTLEQEIQQQLKDRLEHETEQETNDLSKAFRSALRKMSDTDTLTILGATGKREDHTLGNLSLLADFSGQHRKIRLLTDHGTFLPVIGTAGIPCHPGQAVSFFNPTGNPVRLTGKNLKYPVNDLALDRWWTATLNTATADTIELATSPGDATVIVFLNH